MILFENLQKKGVPHGVSEVREGSFNFYTNPRFKERAKNLLAQAGILEKELVLAEQVHGKKVHTCPENIGGYVKLGVDGVVSTSRNHVLLIKSADCAPILMFNPKKKRVGAIHAGREGIRKGVVEEGIKKMENAEALIVGVGPHIKKCCYFFSKKDFEKRFKGTFWDKYSEKKDQGFYLDITKAIVDKLAALGVKEENIEISPFCTFCASDRLFSSRKWRKGRYENFTSFPETGSFISLT